LSKERKRVVVIGGGTGTYTVLLGLKEYPLSLSAIISMMDSGGSNRVLRDEFGLLPTSDIRQCIVALSSDETDGLLRKLFTYRYSKGVGIEGMTFGNLFMVALTDIYGSQEQAIEKTMEFLKVKGEIIPVTYDKTNLVARYSNGKQVLGEHDIDEPENGLAKEKIVELEVFPKAGANKRALKAIDNADLIILGPGDLYTSTLPNIVISGVAARVAASSAKRVLVINMMTKKGQTDGFFASDYLTEIEKYLGRGLIDYCLVNNNLRFSKNILCRYIEEGSSPVKDDLGKPKKPKVIREDFLSEKIYEKSKSDRLQRSLIRHDPKKLAKVLYGLLEVVKPS